MSLVITAKRVVIFSISNNTIFETIKINGITKKPKF